MVLVMYDKMMLEQIKLLTIPWISIHLKGDMLFQMKICDQIKEISKWKREGKRNTLRIQDEF